MRSTFVLDNLRAGLGLTLLLWLSSCTPAPPLGEYGPYFTQTMHLRLPSGDLLPVYRVMYWTFDNGDPPGLQLEYEAPFNVWSDSLAVHREARLIWPEFEPYVNALHLDRALITATNLERKGIGPLTTWHTRHFGIGVSRGNDGRWHATGDTVPLPEHPDNTQLAILQIDGNPLPTSSSPPPVSPLAPSNQRLKLPARVH